MAGFLKWLVVLAAIAAVIAYLPIGGRSVLDRWQAAPTASAFVEKSWQELREAARKMIPANPQPQRAQAARSARTTRLPPRSGSPQKPAERHSEADREAIDEIVAKHVK